jgi:hypothetical protein
MSFNVTSDDIVYEKTTQPENVASKPFIQKQWTNPIFDTNTSSNYTSNQVIFDTTVLSNLGQLVNYQEGIIALPFVIKVTRTTNTDFTGDALKYTDFMLGLKNSHTNIIHSISINLNNLDVLQGVPLTNAYLNFIQHSELSTDDEFLNSPLTGYAKDDSSSWYYNTGRKPDGTAYDASNTPEVLGDSRGVGLGNNCNFGIASCFDSNESFNSGLYKRQKLITKYNGEKTTLMGGVDNPSGNGKSFVLNTGTAKYIYYDCYLRLKDIVPNFFNNIPMSYGVKMKITLTLNNNISFSFKKNTDGNFLYNPNSFSNPTSATNPLMVAASYNKFKSQTGSNWISTAGGVNTPSTAGQYGFSADDATINDSLIPCGSSCLQCSNNDVITVTMKLGSDGVIATPRAQCILYVPSYILSPKYELEYLSESSRYRKFYYTELEYQTVIPGVAGTFNADLSTSCVRPKRLIMIPFLTAAANFGINPVSSPFTTEPSTTSPCMITNFNCQISNYNIFSNDIKYSYDHFLQNMNGSTGINANLMNGLVSSRINLVDFQNNYGYIVCDLSRRIPENDTQAVSIRIRGTVATLQPVEIHCYIEREKWIELDVITGVIRNRG